MNLGIGGRVGRAFLCLALVATGVAIPGLSVAESPAVTSLEPVSVGFAASRIPNSSSSSPDISADGRYVVFESWASNITTDTNAYKDVYLYDRQTDSMVLASVGAGGSLGNNHSANGSVSDDGTRVCFSSNASNLMPGDSNSTYDVFVRDLASGETTVVSAASTGVPGNGYSYYAAVSGNGRYVAFASAASNLVPGDSNGQMDIFRRDLESGETTLVSVSTGGAQSDGYSDLSGVGAISADGTKIVFLSGASNLVAGDTNGTTDVFVRDLAAQTTTRVSVSTGAVEADSDSYAAVISDDGTAVAFQTDSTNLVAGDTNGFSDIFVRNLTGGTTIRASLTNAGGQIGADSIGPSVSADGSLVAFTTAASTVVPGDTNGFSDVFVRNTGAGTTERVSIASAGAGGDNESSQGAMSADGTIIAFKSYSSNFGIPTSWQENIFVRDTVSPATEPVSMWGMTSFAQVYAGGPSINGAGDLVTFSTAAANMVSGDTNGVADVFVRDVASDETTIASTSAAGVPGNSDSGSAAISAVGTHVAFESYANNLVPGDANARGDIFLKNLTTGAIELASVASDGSQGNDESYSPAVAGDGSKVAFFSSATNLVPSDTNGRDDIFVRDTGSGETTIATIATDGTLQNGYTYSFAFSDDGRFVAFASNADNLVPGDSNGTDDVFLRDLVNGTTVCVSINGGSGLPADDRSSNPSISADGRYVAFESAATDLVADDTNGRSDVFIADMVGGGIQRVSLSSAAEEGNGNSYTPEVSGDGSKVAFLTLASNLVSGDTNGTYDVLLRDLAGGETVVVNQTPEGVWANGFGYGFDISAGGAFIAFESAATNLWPTDNNGYQDIYLVGFGVPLPDTVAPTSAAGGVPPGWTSGDVSVTLSAEDTAGANQELAGLDGIRYRIGTSSDATYTAPIDISSEGTTTIEFAAVDKAGNWETSQTVDVRIDKSAPVTTSNAVAAYSGVATITLTPTDSLSGVAGTYYRIDSGTSQSGTTVVVDAPGPHSLDFWSIDNAGNVESEVSVDMTITTSFVPVSGTSRFDTAVEASKKAFPSGASTVVIATARNWPDALGGSALAGVVNGPLLIVDTQDVPGSIVTEIGRLGATQAYVLGGEKAVGDVAYGELETLLGVPNVRRIAGSGRYDTARKIADEVIALQGGSYDGNAFVATGLNYPDALGASPVAAAKGWPILLTPADGTPALPPAVGQVTILGGTKAVTGATESYLKGALGVPNVSRVQGSSRYETAAKAADLGVANGLSWNGVGMATGQSFPDALSGGAMLGRLGSVMLLTPSSTLDPFAASRVSTNKATIASVRYLGGPSAITPAVRNAVQALLY